EIAQQSNIETDLNKKRESKKDVITQLKQTNPENLRSDPTINNYNHQRKKKNSILDRIMSISHLKELNGHNLKTNSNNIMSMSPIMQEVDSTPNIHMNNQRKQKSYSTNYKDLGCSKNNRLSTSKYIYDEENNNNNSNVNNNNTNNND
ncbi:hypothetical protein BCR36DRAFT_253061, partial [Piromyces finnis]